MKNKKLIVSILAILLVGAMLLGILVSVIPSRASAASSSEIQQQIDDLKSEQSENQSKMDELQSQMSENLTQMQDIVDQKKRIDQQVFLLHEQIDNLNEQIAAYGVMIADKQDELSAAEARYQELSDKYRERVRAMEEDGDLSYWSVLFKANSFADLLDRLNMIQEIAASDQRRLAQLQDAAEQVKQAKNALEEERDALQVSKQQLADTEKELGEKRAEADELLAKLVAKGKEYEQYMEQAEQKQDDLIHQIAEKEDEYDEALEAEWWATYVPPATTAPSYPGGDTPPSPNIPGDAYWAQPLPYYTVSSPFGMRLHPIYDVWRMHNGVDLAAAEGTPIYASRSGLVQYATYDDSSGYYVSITHGDGFRSVYLHMTHYIVSEGDYVSQGQVIGYVGSTGDSTGPHLHFSICYNGTYVNPMDYIG